MAAYVLIQIGQSPDVAAGLLPAGRAVRYVFSLFPSFNLAFSLVALSQTQLLNNVCINNVDQKTLDETCTNLKVFSDRFADDPLTVIGEISANPQQFTSLANSFQYFRCCDEQYVSEAQNDLCHNETLIHTYEDFTNLIYSILHRPELNWEIIKKNFECLEIQSFFTYDELFGLNINLLWLFLTALLFVGILILIETGLIERMWSVICSTNSPAKVSRTRKIEKLCDFYCTFQTFARAGAFDIVFAFLRYGPPINIYESFLQFCHIKHLLVAGKTQFECFG